ncbi:hypothetical protein CK203_104458 [Vitis vinifera]|uniref:DUF4283 domain-containing protein n=1 Tax=Vitis vinifera TaxID=29760 RepID=A0A438EAB3_VITVI|nr:hypothetical protein CK203_104458 [Vitis vinifera]
MGKEENGKGIGKKMGDPTPWCVMRTKRGFFSGWGWSIWRRSRHSIIIPKGRGEKGGWVTMARNYSKWEVSWEEGAQAVRVGWGKLVWKDRGEDLELWGEHGKSLGSERQLGLARLEENRVLLEFELLGEAIWGSIIAMEPDHFEKSGGGVWRIYSNGPSDGKVAGASMGSDIDQNRWGRLAKREANERTRGEVRGDGVSRADTRVEKELENTRLEALLLQKKGWGSGGRVGQGACQMGARRSGACPSMDVMDLGPSSLGPELG